MPIVRLAISGNGYESHSREAGSGTQPPCELVAIDLGQADVDQHHFGLERLDTIKRFPGAVGDLGFAPRSKSAASEFAASALSSMINTRRCEALRSADSGTAGSDSRNKGKRTSNVDPVLGPRCAL